MKYTYAYKTSDGVRHEEAMDAPSREVVFQTLKLKGIKAIKVVAADGSKANGEIRGVRKRVLAASVIGAALLAGLGVCIALRTPHPALRTQNSPLRTTLSLLPEQPRQQISGLPQTYDGLFASPSERFLVNFAQPAQPLADAIPSILQPLADDLVKSLETPIVPAEGDTEAVVKLKSVVVGLKQEAARIIRSGRSPVEVIRYFIDRQQMEAEHRKRIIDQVSKGEMSKDTANAMFRTMSFAPID